MIIFVRHILSFLISYFIGLNIFKYLNTYSRSDYFIQIIHSFLLGLGATSLLFWFFTILTNGRNSYYILFELLIVLFLYIRNKKNRFNNRQVNFQLNRVFQINKRRLFISFFLFLLIFAYIIFYSIFIPNGNRDAFYMFNYKAKYLAYEKPDVWHELYDIHLEDTHLDYPLFLSCSVARLFIYANGYNDLSPAILSVIFTFSVFLLLFLYLYKLKGWYFAVIALCILSSSDNYILNGVYQGADIPLSLYILICVYEFILWEKENKLNFQLPLIALFSCSIVLWIKNEGAVFSLLFLIITIFYEVKRKIAITNILKGGIVLLPSILAIIFVHIFYTGVNDLLVNIFSRLNGFLELYRYKVVLTYIFNFIGRNIWLIVIPFLLFKRFTSVVCENVKILLIIPCIAYGLYLLTNFITPNDFYFHICNSFDRITLHYIPMLLFFFLLLIPSERIMNREKV